MASPIPVATVDVYKKVVTDQGIAEDVETINDFNILWIGPRTARSVIVYLCGGALSIPAIEVHFTFLINGYNVMKSNGQDVAIAVVDFGLCPEVPYPNQLRQTIVAVQHLLKARPATKLTLSGDSAGGLLIIELLLHYRHQHPKVDKYDLPTGERFGEAFFISPGGPMASSTSSMLQNPQKDIITLPIIDRLFNRINSTSEVEIPNAWIAPQTAPEDWYKQLPVDKVTFIFGNDEVLRDDILTWANHIKKFHDGPVVINNYPDEYHEQTLVDAMNGITEDKASTKFWKAWFHNFKA